MSLIPLIEQIDTLVGRRAEPSEVKPVIATLHERAEALEADKAAADSRWTALEREHSELKDRYAEITKPHQQPRIGTPPGF